jgi:MFS family permease
VSTADVTASVEAAPPFERSNVARLAIAQALAGANAGIVFATGAIVGNSLAPTSSLATLPISAFVVGTAVATLPAGLIAQRYGRRAVFMTGTACGIVVGLLAAVAVLLASFWLFTAAMIFGGAYMAVLATLRFAAADAAAPHRRARALSFVMGGGLFAGVLGPMLVTFTMDLTPPFVFAATYLAQAGVAVLAGVVLAGVRLPPPVLGESRGGRPLKEIVAQPRFIGAVVAGTISYFIMNFLMTSAPLAMRLCGLSQDSANSGIMWHVIAMYAPSFVTGRLISRFGTTTIIMVGLALCACAAVVGLTGITVYHFWAALILVGVGWNFGFVGASALILETHRPNERTRVQSINDFAVFGTMVVGSFASGGLLNNYGWEAVCFVALPPLAVAAVALWIAKPNAAARTG